MGVIRETKTPLEFPWQQQRWGGGAEAETPSIGPGQGTAGQAPKMTDSWGFGNVWTLETGASQEPRGLRTETRQNENVPAGAQYSER